MTMKQGDNSLGSVCLAVHSFVSALVAELFDHQVFVECRLDGKWMARQVPTTGARTCHKQVVNLYQEGFSVVRGVSL